ncbi:hypothetical protein BC332_01726 [Capsicum chinense]|nr:hypothetical protein BC332_01726 [Capsicum chinense]
MSDVPPDVITEILSRLPVISLLKFRCVSKAFKTLIDSPKFIKAHIKQQQERNPNAHLNLFLKAHNESDNLFSLELTSNTSTQHHPKVLDHPLKQLDGPTQVLGSCRGLVLISNSMSDNGVWNPSTKRFRKLPVWEFNPSRNSSGRAPHGRGPGLMQISGGFGYDKDGEDYKVVTIGQWYHPDDEPKMVSEVMVYSLRYGGWKKVEDCPYWLVKEENGTAAGGALYWLVTKEPFSCVRSWILVGLNLGTERFEKVPFPVGLGKSFQLNLAVLGKCLCLISCYCISAKNHVLDHVDMWMMKDCGVEQSWVKLFTVEQLDGRQNFSFLKPIAYSGTGKEVLLEIDNTKLLWYSLEKKSVKPAKVSGGLEAFESFVNLGTVVPLYYGGGDEKGTKKGMEERDDSVIEEL